MNTNLTLKRLLRGFRIKYGPEKKIPGIFLPRKSENKERERDKEREKEENA